MWGKNIGIITLSNAKSMDTDEKIYTFVRGRKTIFCIKIHNLEGFSRYKYNCFICAAEIEA